VWDISDIAAVAQYRTFQYHRACVWDIGFIEPPEQDRSNRSIGGGSPGLLPAGTFVTCSADSTIRIWNLDPARQRASRWRNPFSRECLHTLELQDTDAEGLNAGAGDGVGSSINSSKSSLGGLGAALTADGASVLSNFCVGLPDTELPNRPQEGMAPRALAVHPRATELACGDRGGRLHVFDLRSMRLLLSSKAHAAEILSMHYSPSLRRGSDGVWAPDSSSTYLSTDASDTEGEEEQPSTMTLLASAGRDRLVHIYDVNRAYKPISTLDQVSEGLDGTGLLTTYCVPIFSSFFLSNSAIYSVPIQNLKR